ncbi:TPA: EAL domain-containing protein [Photobacterium damselae]
MNRTDFQFWFDGINNRYDNIASKTIDVCIIVCVLFISFYCSSFFILEQQKFSVITLISSAMVASYFFLGWRAMPLMICIYLFHFQGLDQDSVAISIYAISTPLLAFSAVWVFEYFYFKAKSHSVSAVIELYFIIIGFLLPVAKFLVLITLESIRVEYNLSLSFIIYATLGDMLTQLTLTPVLLFMFSLWKNDHDSEMQAFFNLSNAIRQSKATEVRYILWLSIFICISITIFFVSNDLIINSMCFVLLILIIVGYGRHGLLQPLCMTTFVVIMMILGAVDRVNNTQNYDAFFGLILVLWVIVTLSYMICGAIVKNYEMLQDKLEADRLDSYTGLFNVKQMLEDLDGELPAVLIYIDLAPTLNRLASMGYKGKSQLIAQLNQYIIEQNKAIKRCYRPAFSTGILSFLKPTSGIDNQLNYLFTQIDGFKFNWSGVSISLVSPTIHCINVRDKAAIKDVLSQLSEQSGDGLEGVNWVDSFDSSLCKIDTLSTIQNIFKTDSFELYCQPYLNLHNPASRKCSFEVLLRIRANAGHSISPAEFFPMIHFFGLEVQLDKWVVENTFRTLNERIQDWALIEKCSINLTAKMVSMPDTTKTILNLAQKYQIDLSKICFEVTESSALKSENQAIETLQQLREAGSKIALDDFGTGYASFSYLRRLPLDILKIDGEFVKDVLNNEQDRLIISSMSLVAKEIGLETVAEFVETEEHIAILQEFDITYAQGYAISKPMPLNLFFDELMAH